MSMPTNEIRIGTKVTFSRTNSNGSETWVGKVARIDETTRTAYGWFTRTDPGARKGRGAVWAEAFISELTVV